MNGWIKKWRKELESTIWEKPPLYLRVWDYLLYAVDHTNGEVADASLLTIAEAVKWKENNKEVVPSKMAVSRVLSWMEDEGMIFRHEVAKSCSIVQWKKYQGFNVEAKTTVATAVTTTAIPEKEVVALVKEEKPEAPAQKKPIKESTMLIGQAIAHYRKIDPDKSIGTNARRIVWAKINKNKRDIEFVKAVIDAWSAYLMSDAWAHDQYRFKGIDWFFRYKFDEQAKKLRHKKEVMDHSDYKEIDNDELERLLGRNRQATAS